MNKMLVVAPHPDDEILGCGGTILKALKGNISVDVLYLSSGDAQTEIREDEARSVGKKLGLSDQKFLRLDDSSFSVNKRNIKRVIEYLKVSKPDVIFVPHKDDGDREHRVAFELINEAYWKYTVVTGEPVTSKALLTYEVHAPMTHYSISEDVSAWMDEKLQLLSLYKSQLVSSDIDKAIQGLNAFRGKSHEGVEYSEVFGVKYIKSVFS